MQQGSDLLELNAAIFHAAAWLVAYFAGISRLIHDGRAGNYWDCIRLGLFSGFLGFGTVCIVRGFWTGPSGDLWYFLGLSAFVGLLGREQEAFLVYLLHALFKKIGMEIETKDGTTKIDNCDARPVGDRPTGEPVRDGDGDQERGGVEP